MKKPKLKDPSLNISIAPRQAGDKVSVDYCITGPADRPIYLFDGPFTYSLDWRLQPGVCTPVENRFPRLYYFKAHLEIPIGIKFTAFVVPNVVRLDPKAISKGTFTVADKLPQVTAARTGEPVEGALVLPARMELQMIVGYGDKPLKVSHTDPQPEQTVLAWQKAISSNVLTIRRQYCWDVELT